MFWDCFLSLLSVTCFRVSFILHFPTENSAIFLSENYKLFCTAYLLHPESCGMFSVMKNSLCPLYQYRTLYRYRSFSKDIVDFKQCCGSRSGWIWIKQKKKEQININFIFTLRVPISSIKKYNCFD